jgi:magnesium-transporting ATPase (P-type)
MKSEIPKTHDLFNYNTNSKNILLKGTELIACSSLLNDNLIKCLVINTSFNTYQGNMIQFLFDDKIRNFKFINELYIFFFTFLLIVVIIGIFLIFFHKGYCPNKKSECIMDYFDGMTILLPAVLPISSTISFLFFHFFLNRNSINCFSEKRLLAASLCNKFIFGKKII